LSAAKPLPRIVHVNGRYVREDKAVISVFDRGFLFGDGVYEVVAVIGGKILEWSGHLARLKRSLKEIGMGMPVSDAELLDIHRRLIRRNQLDQGRIYLEITRGAADREFVFPPAGTPQTIVLFTQAAEVVNPKDAETGIALVSVPDQRWVRRDIKSVAMLAQVLAKQEAKEKGGKEAVMHEDGVVTEAGASSLFMVTVEGRIVTRPNSNKILPGITRASLEIMAAEHQLTFEERLFTLDEMRSAKEVFITAASTFVQAAILLDGKPIGEGKPGPIARRLREIYLNEAIKSAI
jgi:D-alanine transaminase